MEEGPEPHISALENIESQLRKTFTGSVAVDRLSILGSHIATVKMVIEHLFDEATRSGGYK